MPKDENRFDNQENLLDHAQCKKMKHILKELKPLGVVFFSYFEQFNNKEICCLISNEIFLGEWVDRDLFFNYPFFSNLTSKEGWYLWDLIFEIPLFYPTKNIFTDYNVEAGTSFVEIDKSTKKVFHFGFDDRRLFSQVAINHTDILQRFILFFKEFYLKTIGVSYRYILPENIVTFFNNETFSHEIIDSTKTKIEKLTKNSPKIFSDFSLFVERHKLTCREAECLNKILLGCSSKKIAYDFNISKRTVDEHIQKIRKKTECRTQVDLILKFAIQSDAVGWLT